LPFPVTPSLLSQYDRNTDTSKKRANNASADKSFMAMQSVSDVTSLALASVLSFEVVTDSIDAIMDSLH
jgi:hypothetical protein